ncbi:hypothetical protein BT69DRAFT_1341730 [Atractiella rhizophila]|nr:hypothetical protein BT69DRAFT_1341730 [Atractiella rhizophila]
MGSPEDDNNCVCTTADGKEVNHKKYGASCSLQSDKSSGVRFADLDGGMFSSSSSLKILTFASTDGRADYLYVASDGKTQGYWNYGDSNFDVWEPSGEILGGAGATRQQIHFADMNGDKREDFLIVKPNGAVDCYLNGDILPGRDPGKPQDKLYRNWIAQNEIASGIPTGDGNVYDGAGVRFADMDGDGRAEYIWIHPTAGALTMYHNHHSQDAGSNACKVAWYPKGVIATGAGFTRESIILKDVTGDGRADYLLVDREGGKVYLMINVGPKDPGCLTDVTRNFCDWGWHPFPPRLLASGDTFSGLPGGWGIQFADLNGDGRAEFLNIKASDSSVYAYQNLCP